MDMWEYENFIKDLVSKTGLFVSYTTIEKDVPLSFSIMNDTLNISPRMIFNILQNKPYPNLNDTQVLTIMVCHELGHIKELRIDTELQDKLIRAVDSKDNDVINRFLLEREEKAWELGKQYVPQDLVVEYDDLNKNCVDIYKGKCR